MFSIFFLFLIHFFFIVRDGVVRVTGIDGVFISSNLILNLQESGIVGMVSSIDEKRCKYRTLGKESIEVEEDLIIHSASIVETTSLNHI